MKDMSFLFLLVAWPVWDSNIPSKMLCASVGWEILRISRITTDLIDMVTSVDLLLIRVRKKGSDCEVSFHD